MKIGFDIGGVISKYPKQFHALIRNCCNISEIGLKSYANNIYIISDMHPKDKIITALNDNGFDYLHRDNIYCADYDKYGNMAKAMLIKELGLAMFIDDFDGYLQWDSSLGPQPILLKIQPDAFKPYWHPDWKQDGGDFGRRTFNGM